MRIFIVGQGAFGAAVFERLHAKEGITVEGVAGPALATSGGPDRLRLAAGIAGVRWQLCETGTPIELPALDLIVGAHPPRGLTQATLDYVPGGGVSYHPSLLPLHRGPDPVEWTIERCDRVAGGSVHRMLGHGAEGEGDVLMQRPVLVHPRDTTETLWTLKLFPLGVDLLERVVDRASALAWCGGLPLAADPDAVHDQSLGEINDPFPTDWRD